MEFARMKKESNNEEVKHGIVTVHANDNIIINKDKLLKKEKISNIHSAKNRKKAASLPKSVQDIILPCITAERKFVPHWYLYDTCGSKLFSNLALNNPHYHIYWAEVSIIQKYAGEISGTLCGSDVIVSELGAGGSTKTVPLLESLLESRENVEFVPIDVAKEFMEENAKSIQEKYKDLVVTPFAGDYDDGIEHIKTCSKPVLFNLFGNGFGNIPINNMLPFLHNVKKNMKEGDRFVIGLDLMQNIEKLEKAYTDPGTEIPFNKNMLTRLNRDFDADFNLDDFELHFDYVISEDTEVYTHPQYVQLSLRCLKDHTIHLRSMGKKLTMRKGEKIYTHELENMSVKWTWPQFVELTEKAGLHLEKKWMDKNRSFGLACLRLN